MIGNGLKDENNGIGNIKVELVEKLANGGEYVWRTTTLGNKTKKQQIQMENMNSKTTYQVIIL